MPVMSLRLVAILWPHRPWQDSHLARSWQVGGGISPTLDAYSHASHEVRFYTTNYRIFQTDPVPPSKPKA